MRKIPNVTDEPEEQKRVWRAVEEACNFSVFQADRKIIWEAIAHELAEQQRAFLRSKGTVWTGSTGQVIDHIDPKKQR